MDVGGRICVCGGFFGVAVGVCWVSIRVAAAHLVVIAFLKGSVIHIAGQT